MAPRHFQLVIKEGYSLAQIMLCLNSQFRVTLRGKSPAVLSAYGEA